jgi:hypothetical protein
MADVGADRTFNVSGAGVGALALSPDGKLLAFSAQQAAGTSQLYIRRLDHLQATALGDTRTRAARSFLQMGSGSAFLPARN